MISTKERINILKEKHRQLKDRVMYAEKNLEGDLRIGFLKKLKLKVKDEITRLEKQCMQ